MLWAFAAPNASSSALLSVATQIAVFGGALAVLYALDRPQLASVFATTVIVNAALMAAWGQ